MDKVENIYDYYNAETKVITMPKNDVYIPPEGMAHILFESMNKHLEKTAMIDLTKRESYTYDDILTRAVRTAIKLRNVGIKPGDMVSICCHNQRDSISVFLGVILMGGIHATLEPSMQENDLKHLMSLIDTKIFFVSSNCEKLIEKLRDEMGLDSKIIVFGETERNLPYADFSCPQGGEDDFKPYIPKDLDEMFMILFSSGSTGLPKAMWFNHRYFGYHTGNSMTLESIFILSNIYWTGAIHTTITQWRTGNTIIFASTFDPVGLWEHMETFKIKCISLLPHNALALIENKPKKWNGELQVFTIVGSSMSKENFLKIREALPRTYIGSLYAMSETTTIMNAACPIAYKKLNSIGRPLKGIQYKVVDPETQQNVGFNVHGELRVKSPYQLKGYYKGDSSGIWDEEGYFQTGDVVYYDEDFSFFVVDRIKEMFKYKDNQIIPAKFESILENHPEIAMCALIGIPHARDGCHTMAAVVLKKGATITPKEIEDYYNARIIDYAKIIAGVRVLGSMPITVSGKIARKTLKEIILKEMK